MNDYVNLESVILYEPICCDILLEPSHRDVSNKGVTICVYLRSKKTCTRISFKSHLICYSALDNIRKKNLFWGSGLLD